MLSHPKQKTFAKASTISPGAGVRSCRTGAFLEADFAFLVKHCNSKSVSLVSRGSSSCDEAHELETVSLCDKALLFLPRSRTGSESDSLTIVSTSSSRCFLVSNVRFLFEFTGSFEVCFDDLLRRGFPELLECF